MPCHLLKHDNVAIGLPNAQLPDHPATVQPQGSMQRGRKEIIKGVGGENNRVAPGFCNKKNAEGLWCVFSA